jgi:hypothetical protein
MNVKSQVRKSIDSFQAFSLLNTCKKCKTFVSIASKSHSQGISSTQGNNTCWQCQARKFHLESMPHYSTVGRGQSQSSEFEGFGWA